MPWHESVIEAELAKTKILINASAVADAGEKSPITGRAAAARPAGARPACTGRARPSCCATRGRPARPRRHERRHDAAPPDGRGVQPVDRHATSRSTCSSQQLDAGARRSAGRHAERRARRRGCGHRLTGSTLRTRRPGGQPDRPPRPTYRSPTPRAWSRARARDRPARRQRAVPRLVRPRRPRPCRPAAARSARLRRRWPDRRDVAGPTCAARCRAGTSARWACRAAPSRSRMAIASWVIDRIERWCAESDGQLVVVRSRRRSRALPGDRWPGRRPARRPGRPCARGRPAQHRRACATAACGCSRRRT